MVEHCKGCGRSGTDEYMEPGEEYCNLCKKEQGPIIAIYEGTAWINTEYDGPSYWLIGQSSMDDILGNFKGKRIKLTIEVIPEGD